jgi:hypothetical protein
MKKMQSFNENMLGKFLGFGRMKTKHFFLFFLKREIDLKVFEILFFENVLKFVFLKYFRENRVF